MSAVSKPQPEEAVQPPTRKRSAPTKHVPGRGSTSRANGAAAPAGLVEAAELRARWAQARRIVGEVVGRDGEHDPRIWERGAYQLWLWLVVELLVVRRDDLEVSELSAISKMLHEQRKLSLNEQKQAGAADGQGNGQGPPGRLPERFGELVRQIYGANFQGDAVAACGQDPSPDKQSVSD